MLFQNENGISVFSSISPSLIILSSDIILLKSAWTLYESMGFKRFEEADFLQGELPVSGFRLML